jgi:hypothetical protein
MAPTSIAIPAESRSVDDVLAALLHLEEGFRQANDRRGVFVSAYLVITRMLDEWVSERRFHRNNLVAHYVIAFANAYLRALAAFEDSGRSKIAGAWRQALTASRRGSGSLIQDLLLGINAHINHDLPFAIIEAGLDVDCDLCRRDHLRINEALRQAIPLVRERVVEFYEPCPRIASAICGRVVDSAVAEALVASRSNSWQWATALQSASSGHERRRIATILDERATAVGDRMLAARYRPLRCIRYLHRVPHSDLSSASLSTRSLLGVCAATVKERG